ncbi:MAG: helix-turn-helix transcriptional regulator [Pseudomonadota bacterium]
MNIIRLLRQRCGATQSELAELAGTSQPTVAAYESGRKSPSLRTVHRLAAAVGLVLEMECHPPLTREDRRSLKLHRAIADQLDAESIRRARRTLDRLKRQHPHARALLARWSLWLDLPSEDLKVLFLHPGMVGRDMRQVSPFAGILSARERMKQFREFREEELQSESRAV